MKIFVLAISFLTFLQLSDETIIMENMNKYDIAIQKMDAEGVSNIYAVNGKLGDYVKGRTAIKNYLNSYKNTKVVSYQSKTSKLKVAGNIANHEGTFFQTVVSNGNTIKNNGKFRIVWVREGKDWKISTMKLEDIQQR